MEVTNILDTKVSDLSEERKSLWLKISWAEKVCSLYKLSPRTKKKAVGLQKASSQYYVVNWKSDTIELQHCSSTIHCMEKQWVCTGIGG